MGDGVVWVGGLRGVGEAKVGQDWMSVGVGGVLNWEIVSSRSCVCTRYAMRSFRSRSCHACTHLSDMFRDYV